MKRTHFSYGLLLAAPLLLTACNNVFDTSAPAPDYSYNDTMPQARTTVVTPSSAKNAPIARRTEVTSTTLAEPNSAAPGTPKLKNTHTTPATGSASSVPTSGPSVPSMAPAVGQ